MTDRIDRQRPAGSAPLVAQPPGTATPAAAPDTAPAAAPRTAPARSTEPVPIDDRAPPVEHGGPAGPEPTRYGDWERKGRCIDF